MNKCDPYTYTHYALLRLEKEYQQHGKIIVAFDFDGTIFDFHNEGYIFPRVVKVLQLIKPYAHLVVYTCSKEERYPFIHKHLDECGILYDSINEVPKHLNVPKGGKMYYNILLDDRAGLGQTLDILEEFIRMAEDKK